MTQTSKLSMTYNATGSPRIHPNWAAPDSLLLPSSSCSDSPSRSGPLGSMTRFLSNAPVPICRYCMSEAPLGYDERCPILELFGPKTLLRRHQPRNYPLPLKPGQGRRHRTGNHPRKREPREWPEGTRLKCSAICRLRPQGLLPRRPRCTKHVDGASPQGKAGNFCLDR